jgi:hypothetical protein
MKKKMHRTSAEYHEILRLLQEFFKDDEKKVEYWLHTKNLNFGNLSPNFLIERGRAHKVLQFIKDAKEGNKP